MAFPVLITVGALGVCWVALHAKRADLANGNAAAQPTPTQLTGATGETTIGPSPVGAAPDGGSPVVVQTETGPMIDPTRTDGANPDTSPPSGPNSGPSSEVQTAIPDGAGDAVISLGVSSVSHTRYEASRQLGATGPSLGLVW